MTRINDTFMADRQSDRILVVNNKGLEWAHARWDRREKQVVVNFRNLGDIDTEKAFDCAIALLWLSQEADRMQARNIETLRNQEQEEKL